MVWTYSKSARRLMAKNLERRATAAFEGKSQECDGRGTYFRWMARKREAGVFSYKTGVMNIYKLSIVSSNATVITSSLTYVSFTLRLIFMSCTEHTGLSQDKRQRRYCKSDIIFHCGRESESYIFSRCISRGK